MQFIFFYKIGNENRPAYEDYGEDTPLTIKHILTERPSINTKRRQLFGTTTKTMKQLLIDGNKSYGGALDKIVINFDLLTKL